MLMTERQQEIVRLITENGSVLVEELAKELNVSTMTIRRDLEHLDEKGVVERCHGGAVAKNEVTYEQKQSSNQKEKMALAKIAAALVKEGDTVYLDAGTTTYEVAKLLANIEDLMVVTNDLEIARLLRNTQVELMLCGGYVQKSTGSMLGYYATAMMENFRFDIGFFGAASIDDEFCVLTPTVDKAFLKQQLARQCQEAYLVVDDSKFHKEGTTKVYHLSALTGVITNHQLTKDEEKSAEKTGIHIL
jgi:DeoR/GlpR family transcriptional regulator of sugar metabolism